MLEKEIAKLYGTLQFRADYSQLMRFRKMLQQTQRQMDRLNKSANMKFKSAFGPTKTDVAKQEAVVKKLHAVAAQAQAKADTAKAKGQMEIAKIGQQHIAAQARGTGALLRLDAQRQRNIQASNKASIIAQQAQVKLEQDRQRLVQRTAQAQAAQARLEAFHARARATAERAASKVSKGGPHGRGFAGRFLGSVDTLGGGMRAGFAGGLPMAGMMASGPVLALTALATAAAAAAAALKGFGNAAVAAAERDAAKMVQFNAIFDGDKQLAEGENTRFLAYADKVGANAADIAPDYTKALMGIKDGGSTIDASRALVQGVMALNTASGGSGETLKGAFKALTQASGKGQLYSEEWTQQFAEHMPGAKKLGAQAWQEATGGKLTGTEAGAAFSKDMQAGLIKGDALTKFFNALGPKLLAEANRGGRLEAMGNTHSAMQARQQNALNANYLQSYRANDGKLQKSQFSLDRSMLDLIKASSGFMDRLASSAADLNNWLAEALDHVTVFMDYLDGNKDTLDGIVDPEKLATFELFVDTVKTGFNTIKETVSLIGSLLDGGMGSLFLDTINIALKVVREIFTMLTEAISGVRGLAEKVGLIKPQEKEGVTPPTKFTGDAGYVPDNKEEREYLFNDDGIPLGSIQTTRNGGVPLTQEEIAQTKADYLKALSSQAVNPAPFQAKVTTDTAAKASKTSPEDKKERSATVDVDHPFDASKAPTAAPTAMQAPATIHLNVKIDNNGLGEEATKRVVVDALHDVINSSISDSGSAK